MQALTSFVCSVFYIGFIPYAPGTFGSIAAVVFAAAIKFDIMSMVVWAAVLFVVGYIFSDIYEHRSGRQDPKEVVIDEFVGTLITLAIAFLFVEEVLAVYWLKQIEYFMLDVHLYKDTVALIAVILFRFFDIVKPGIIGKIDKNTEGGMGIMLDDVVAGVFAGITFIIISPFILLILQILL